jgi:hypothetical protein
MRIGMVTDSLSHLSLDELLRTVAELGIEMLEFPCGNWSSAPHLKLDAMLDSAAMRDEFMLKLRSRPGAERVELLRQSAASRRAWAAASGGDIEDDPSGRNARRRARGDDVWLPWRTG